MTTMADRTGDLENEDAEKQLVSDLFSWKRTQNL